MSDKLVAWIFIEILTFDVLTHKHYLLPQAGLHGV
jgi:hypothetical protein